MPIANKPAPDYEPESDFESFSDGKYKITAITWITKDDQGAPCFVPSKGISPIVARYRSNIGEKDGPPGSVAPEEVSLLVRAFGVSPDKLPDREKDPTAFLLAARDLINNSGKEVDVTVSGGWINSIKGMDLPADSYFIFKYGGVSTKNDEGLPAPKQGQYGKWFGVNLVVDGDIQQRPTPYDGVGTFTIVPYGLTVNEDGIPAYEEREPGKWTASAFNCYRFMRTFAPGVHQQDFGDVANILPEMDEIARKSGVRAVGQVTRNKKGRVGIDISSLQALDGATPQVHEETKEELPVRNVEDEVKEPPTIQDIYRTIDELCGEPAFDEKDNLTDAGKVWCRDNLRSFLTEHKWPARFLDWTEEQRTEVLAFLMSFSDESDF